MFFEVNSVQTDKRVPSILTLIVDYVSPSFREATFTDLRDDGEKRIANKLLQGDLYVEPAYRDRVRIQIQDTKASMTILTARRSDSGRYKFEIETINDNKVSGVTSIIEISVQCKYIQKCLVVSRTSFSSVFTPLTCET